MNSRKAAAAAAVSAIPAATEQSRQNKREGVRQSKGQTRGAGRRREDQPLYRLVFPMLMGLALAGMAVFGYQLFANWQDRGRAAHLDRTVDWAVEAVGSSIREKREPVAALASSPRVREAFPDDGSRVPGDRARGLGDELPGEPEVALFPATVDERDVTGYPGLDFASLDLIWQFIDSGETPPAEIHFPGTDKAHLALLEPVFGPEGESLVGFLRAAYPVAALYGLLDQAAVPSGYLGLVQGEGGWRDVKLHALGDAGLAGATGGDSRPVPGTRLRVASAYRPGFMPLGPMSPALLWAGIIGCTLLLVGVAALRFYLPTIQVRMQDRRDRAERAAAGEPEPAVVPSAGPREPRGEPAAGPPPAPKKAPPEIAESIFRAYDIRGVVDDTLTPATAKLIGQAIGSEALDRGLKDIVVARDGRRSGPELVRALVEGLTAAGCQVIDIGAVPTPVLYFATHQLRTDSGVMVTGSHNPPEYNGFKIVLGGETLAEDAIAGLRRRIVEGKLHEGEGTQTSADVTGDYIERISGDIQLQRPLKVVLDAGNGIAGDIAPRLMQAIGADPVPLYCEVDGSFPNHHPDPSDPANLADLIDTVRDSGADVGLAFDGDGDRLGVVTRSGENIYPDRLMMLFSRDVLLRNPGAAIIFDVKCSGRLADQVLELGGSPIMWKTGHSLIKAKLKETGAMLAGEMSGHFFFTERWYGFDDGLYAACRLLEILAAEPEEPGEVLEGLPSGVSTPELKVQMAEGETFEFLEKFRKQARFDEARITTIDGLRADFPDGWGLVRCSNTTPCLVLRFEGDDEDALDRVKDAFRKQLRTVDPDISLPF